jgi:hypothetical protein
VKKPYRMTFSATVVVMARDERDAHVSVRQSDYAHLLEVTETVPLTRESALPWYWQDDSLVFGAERDTTLTQALNALEAQ